MSAGLLIGQVAQAAGVDPKTVRYYEEIELLPPARRSESGYRLYDEVDVARLRFVRGARSLGWRLREIREVLVARDRGEPPCHHVMALLVDRLQSLDVQIQSLRELRAELRHLHKHGSRLRMDSVGMTECVCQLIGRRGVEPGQPGPSVLDRREGLPSG